MRLRHSRLLEYWPVYVFLILIVLSAARLYAYGDAEKHRIYSHRLEPRENPDDSRRFVKPPDWETFGNRTRFAALRGFAVQDDQIIDYEKELDKYVRDFALGDVIWPSYPILFAKNLGDLADEIKCRNLFLFDIWGYVPGSGPGGYWQQYKPPEGVFDLLEEKLGERWLGMDVGEQDGRYIGGYASQMVLKSSDRFKQYLNFQRHFQRMCDDLGNKMSTLVSLNFGHYFLKEGVYTLIGAETAQGLPNGQVYYSFIRGAGKQYGVPWFGNASIFNRWGYKTYGSEGVDHSPTKGTSLSLFKRLIYSHILYNSVFVGFENGWFDAQGEFSPIGKMQASANRWVQEQGQPGEMIVPIALMLDFYSGWSFPRHLYSGDVYRVWGNLPYEEGDYLTDGVLDMLYPGYQDSSYFHDEKGFLTPTPYGDSADCLLSDAPLWLLKRYAVLVIAGEMNGGLEIRDKLLRYAESGGHLIITSGNLAKFVDGLAGIQVDGPAQKIEAGVLQIGGETRKEEFSFMLYPLRFPPRAKVLAQCGERPAAVEIDFGAGRITALASSFGVCSQPAVKEIENRDDRSLPKPYPLLNHVRIVLDKVFRQQMLFGAGDDLSLIVCRKRAGEYTLGIGNNSWEEKPLQIVSHGGPILEIQESPFDSSEKQAIGYLPETVKNPALGASDGDKIAGGDYRIFIVKIQEQAIELIAHEKPPARPVGRILPLRNIDSLKEAILARPTFFEHYDGAAIDWNYLRRRDKNVLRNEAGWIVRQGLRVIVDMSSGINLYPDLRLIDNDPEEYAKSIAIVKDVLEKMEILSAHDLLLSLHRFPENNFTEEQTWNSFDKTLKEICQLAGKRSITVHLRLGPGKPPWNLKQAAQFLDRIAAPNFRLAPSAALLLSQRNAKEEITDVVQNRIGMWLACAPAYDARGQLWSANAAIASYQDKDRLQEILAMAADVPILFDVDYRSLDEEYLDAQALEIR
ncbi:MAG: TIM barrel protein [Candidatus Omnitrophota bacterium]